MEGVRQFNQKAKKGLRYFIDNGFIAADDPKDIAKFLLTTDGLDKATIGEYLGKVMKRTLLLCMHLSMKWNLKKQGLSTQ